MQRKQKDKRSDGQDTVDSHFVAAIAPLATELPGEGHVTFEAQRRNARSRQPEELSEGHYPHGTPGQVALAQLAELQVRRKFFINAVNRQTNAAGALVRRALGWKSDDEEGARDKVKTKAAKIVSDALNGKGCELASVASDLEVIAQSIAPLEAVRHECELAMKRVMRKLPIWAAWAENIRGLGELGCAVILAETGDLGNYANPGKVWKRLGLAPLNGKAMSTWRRDGGLTAEDWTAAGYSPRRRAEIYSCVGDPLFRQQTMVTGPYRVAYDKRRAHTAETHADWTKLHSHNDALRIMTKELIRDLWSRWRQASDPLEPHERASAADNSSEAIRRLPPIGPLPRSHQRQATDCLKPNESVPAADTNAAKAASRATDAMATSPDLPGSSTNADDQSAERLASEAMKPRALVPDAPSNAGKPAARARGIVKSTSPVPELLIARDEAGERPARARLKPGGLLPDAHFIPET